MSACAISNESLKITLCKKDNMACLLTVLWSVKGKVRVPSSGYKPYVVCVCVCVGKTGLLCLLENGKSDKRSHRVTTSP